MAFNFNEFWFLAAEDIYGQVRQRFSTVGGNQPQPVATSGQLQRVFLASAFHHAEGGLHWRYCEDDQE